MREHLVGEKMCDSSEGPAAEVKGRGAREATEITPVWYMLQK